MTNDSDVGSRDGDERIHLRPYDSAWPTKFEREATVLAEALGSHVVGGVHHVGSTAVPGLTAKPIIDIMIGVRDLDSSRPCIALLAEYDYCYAPHRQEVMHWFCKPDPSRRTHHLHLVPTGSPRFTDVLAFRDYLRAHPAAVRQYEELKQWLAIKHADDRDAYTDGKAAMISDMTAEARRWLTANQRAR
jgi:GrpB-like predicted nucleotidyltransferase (UPF0157 family)